MSRPVPCPRCQKADVDTVASAPFIRGVIVSHALGMKHFVGCRSCVRKQLAKEVAQSLYLGWFSPIALVVNPLCILWNGLRIPFLKPSPAKVESYLRDLGIGPDIVDLPRVAASLAATMVAADGRVDPSEVEVATSIGIQLIDGFTPSLFSEVLDNVSSLPGTEQLAGMLREVLDESGKVSTLKYLLAIASADGTIDDREITELQAASLAMGISLQEL